MGISFDLKLGEGVCFVCGERAAKRYRHGFGVIDACQAHEAKAQKQAIETSISLGVADSYILQTCARRIGF